MSVEGSAPAVFIHNLCDQFWAGLLLLLLSSSSSSSFLSFFTGTMSCICFHNVADMVGKPQATFHNTPVTCFSAGFKRRPLSNILSSFSSGNW